MEVKNYDQYKTNLCEIHETITNDDLFQYGQMVCYQEVNLLKQLSFALFLHSLINIINKKNDPHMQKHAGPCF